MLNNNFKIIAYRGVTELFPENSIEAIQASIKACRDVIIEIDLQITKDHKIIAFHDFQLENLTNGTGLVNNRTLNELKELYLRNIDTALGSKYNIPTLEEIFETFPNQFFILDFHEYNILLINTVIDIVEKYKMQNQIAVVSNVQGITEAIRKLRNSWTFVASPRETKNFIFASIFYMSKFAKVSSNIMFVPEKLGRFKILNSRLIKVLHSRNIKVWTCENFNPYQNVNSKLNLKRLIELGVDGFIQIIHKN